MTEETEAKTEAKIIRSVLEQGLEYFADFSEIRKIMNLDKTLTDEEVMAEIIGDYLNFLYYEGILAWIPNPYKPGEKVLTVNFV